MWEDVYFCLMVDLFLDYIWVKYCELIIGMYEKLLWYGKYNIEYLLRNDNCINVFKF